MSKLFKKYADFNLTLVTHSARIVDINLANLGESIPRYPEKLLERPLGRPLDWGPLGCTQIMKRNILDRADAENRFPTPHKGIDPFPHDFWASLVANALGSTAFVEDDLLLYRRHGRTASSAGKLVEDSSLAKSRAAGAEAYHALSDIDRRISQTFLKYRNCSSERIDRELFELASTAYAHRSLLMSNRAHLYEGTSLFDRASLFSSILFSGGYQRSATSPLSLRSLLKDAAKVILGRRL